VTQCERTRFFLTCVGILFLLTATASAQSTVTVIGPITPGDCTAFNSQTVLKDAGTTCGAGNAITGLTGDVTATGPGSVPATIAPNAVTNAKAAQAGAATIKGNPTASTANVQDFTVQGLSNLASPNTTLDLVPIWNHTTGTIQNVTPSAIAGAAGVTSFNGRTGAVVPASGDYNAGQITYLTPGTGGVSTTVAAELNRTIWANDYGAVCNGSTDDHVAFQNSINEAQTLGAPLRFLGTCIITTALSVTAALDFSGATNTSALGPPGTIDTIDISTTAAVYLHDFTITYTSTPTSTSAITVSAPATLVNSGSRFWNLTINSPFIGVNYLNADNWILTKSTIAAAGITNGSAVHVADSVNVDAGDNTIYGNLLQAGPGGIVINWVSSGGLRIENNKLLSANAAVGIQFSLAPGAATSDVIIANNSIEGFQTSGSVGISFGRQGTTGSLSNVIVANNQIGGPMFCVLHPTDANGAWTNGITVTGNICQPGSAANGVGVVIDSAQGVVVSNNNFISGAATDIPIQIGTATASATGCVVTYNPRIGTWSAGGSTVGTCTSAAPF
jgi:hypothetical protein